MVELAENAVEMAENYDNTDLEPLYMPVRFPVGVINGTSGISAGYASNIPSHNPSEIMSACRKLLKNPEMTGKQLMRTVKGPDFNMGGTIVGDDGIREYFETGGGTFRIRAIMRLALPRGKTRIDFAFLTARHLKPLLSKLQENRETGLFKNLASYKIKDLEHLSVSVETKVQYEQVLADLFEHTSLESSFRPNYYYDSSYGPQDVIVDLSPALCLHKRLIECFIYTYGRLQQYVPVLTECRRILKAVIVQCRKTT